MLQGMLRAIMAAGPGGLKLSTQPRLRQGGGGRRDCWVQLTLASGDGER